MQKRHRNNIIVLIFTLLFLLVYPTVSKIGHVHHGEKIHHHMTDAISLEQSEESCLVCDFEFYNYALITPLTSFVFMNSIPVFNAPEPVKTQVQIITYFSLRAPPLA